LEADLELSLPTEEDEEQGRHAIHFVVVQERRRLLLRFPPTFHIEQLFPQADAAVVVPLVNDTFLETQVVKVSLLAQARITLFFPSTSKLIFFFFHSSTDSKTFLVC
jgi:hypothetical protein